MGFKQKLIKALTPKNTEEVKPNLFIQAKSKGDDLITRLEKSSKGHQAEITYPKWRQIYPAIKNNKPKWSIIILGAKPIKSTFIFLLILFLAWSYHHDIVTIQDTATRFVSNYTFRVEFCKAALDDNQSYFLSDGCKISNDVNVSQIIKEINLTTYQPPKLDLSNYSFTGGNK